MSRRVIFLSLPLFTLAVLAGCSDMIPRSGKSNGNGEKTPAKDIGGNLYKAEEYKGLAVAPPDLLIPGHLTVFLKADVPSQRDGKIYVIGTEADAGQKDSKEVFPHPFDKTKFFRQFRDSERVRRDQLVAVLDDRQAYQEVKKAEAGVDAAKAEAKEAEAIAKLSKVEYDRVSDAYKKGAANEFELNRAKLQWDRSVEGVAVKNAGVQKAEQELASVKVLHEFHYLRAPLDGIMIPTNRKSGEAVRASETVVQIQNVEKLRLEGLIDPGYRAILREGMQVMVEPAIEINQQSVQAHFLPITSVAVANAPAQDPYYISASEDKSVRVWQGLKQIAMLPHPSAVRSVVCTPPGVSFNYCLTGADDGKLRLWDLATGKMIREFKSAAEENGFQHRGQITALAFSPNGSYAVSADDQDICLWQVNDGQLKYRFPSVHRGAISTLAFTPQCKLISAGRDNTLRVWRLGTAGAQEEYRQEGRSGDVAVLGVSGTGERVLFDFQQSLSVLGLKDKKVEGLVQPGVESGRFATFALFSPDDAYILTGSHIEGRLSLYRAPSADNFRAAEVRQFRPENRLAQFTCAVFSPHAQASFAVTGTRSGDLYVWRMPDKNDVKPLSAKVTFVDHSTDTSSRQIRVWAELDNPRDANGEELLMPGKTATMVIKMGQLTRTNRRPIEPK